MFDDYGTKKIEFDQLAKQVWEDNQFDVIIEPAGLYWYEMAQHWPEAKFINLVRDVDNWAVSLKEFVKANYDQQDGSTMYHLLANNEHISPTAHHAINKAIDPYRNGVF